MAEMTETLAPPAGGTRRDFLVLLAGTVTTVGAGCALWSLVDSMNPSADVVAAGVPIDIDLSRVKPGQQIVVLWRSRPIFIVNRTAPQLKMLREARDIDLLSDPKSQVHQQPAYAQNWHRSIRPQYLVLVGICTHLGCIPHYEPALGGQFGPQWPGGYFCPCHGSRYDLSGRVFAGVPAPYNLPVPPYHFLGDKAVRIGENPPGAHFEFSSIVQI
jgi:ubiquinol-cytochrome c reductase iron-sulfur subunit